MSNLTTTGLISVLMLVGFMLIGMTVASVITEDTTDTISEEDFDQMLDETLDEISTYLSIKDQKGKFNKVAGQYRLDQIAIHISPLISQEIDLSQLIIQINDNENVRILTFSNHSEKIGSNNLFGHPIWSYLTGENFAIISILDNDDSLISFNAFNENSDHAYIVFKLPENMHMKKYDELTVSLFPSSGITKTLHLKAPMPMKPVITFE